MQDASDNALHVIDISGTQPSDTAQVVAINTQWQLL